ncbi:hypothetical protein ACFC8N_30525 [Streptomyces sp. NPDC055966]
MSRSTLSPAERAEISPTAALEATVGEHAHHPDTGGCPLVVVRP